MLVALRWIATAIALAVFVNVVATADLGRAWGLVSRIGPPIALVALPYLLIIGFDALAWRWVFAILGRDLAFHRLFSVRLATEAILLSFPGGAILAETLKPWLLLRREGVPVAETTATLAAKKVLLVSTQSLYLGAAAILGWAGLLAISEVLLRGPALPWMILAVAVALLVASALMLATFLYGALGARTHGLLARVPVARFRAFIAERRAGFEETDGHLAAVFGAHLGKLAACAIPFVLSWLAETLESWTILTLLGARLGFVEVMSFEAVVSLMRSIVFFVPAGLGVQDVGYMAALRAIYAVGAGASGAFAGAVPDPTTLGAAFVVVKRAKEVFWIVIGYGLLAMVRSGPMIADTSGRRDEPTSG